MANERRRDEGTRMKRRWCLAQREVRKEGIEALSRECKERMGCCRALNLKKKRKAYPDLWLWMDVLVVLRAAAAAAAARRIIKHGRDDPAFSGVSPAIHHPSSIPFPFSLFPYAIRITMFTQPLGTVSFSTTNCFSKF
ncbi:hypothetical protein L249_1595, partial [Ophiocordyceps polyrhachis-furcata BCC 54312]